jgi:tetratricopeptide (TPR) repeat protein
MMAVAGVELARAWGRERARWRDYYRQQLAGRLDWAVDYVRGSRPSELRAHLGSLLTLLRRARPHPHLYPRMVALIVALHPWPLRWLRWEAWEREIRFAIQVYADLHPQRQAEFQSYLAKLLFDTGRLDEALTVGAAALAQARAYGTVKPLALAGCTVVQTLLQYGRSDEARRKLCALLAEVSAADSVSQRERTLALARLRLQQLVFLRRDDCLDEAVIQAGQIIAQLEALPSADEHLIAMAHRERSTMAWAAGHYAEAVREIQRAIQMSADLGDEFAEANARGNLGLIYYTMTEFDRAEEEIRRLIMMAERLNARWHLTYAVDYLAVIYLMRGELDRAARTFDHAVDLVQSLGDLKSAHRIQSNRAVAWLYQGEYEAAIPDLEADFDFSEEQNLSGAVVMDCICLSLCYQGLGQEEQAIRLAERAWEVAQRLGKPVFQALALRCLAEHRPAQRFDLLERALTLARKAHRPLDEAACLLSLAGLTEDEDERRRLWQRGVRILARIGATAWLAGASPRDPPRIIILM